MSTATMKKIHMSPTPCAREASLPPHSLPRILAPAAGLPARLTTCQPPTRRHDLIFLVPAIPMAVPCTLGTPDEDL